MLGTSNTSPLFGISYARNARITDQGLIATPQQKIILNDGNEITTTSSADVVVALPGWRFQSADIKFEQSINLLAKNLSNLDWQSTTATDGPDSSDFFLLTLAHKPIIMNDELVVYSESQSKMRYNSVDYNITTVFSNDFPY